MEIQLTARPSTSLSIKQLLLNSAYLGFSARFVKSHCRREAQPCISMAIFWERPIFFDRHALIESDYKRPETTTPNST